MNDAQRALNDRLDDIAHLFSDEGHGRRSRTELIRSLVFALPLDSPDQVERIVRLGSMRFWNEVGGFDNGAYIVEMEDLLGWYRADVSRTELVDELQRVRRELRHLKRHLDNARKTVAELIDPVVVSDAAAESGEAPSPLKEKDPSDAR